MLFEILGASYELGEKYEIGLATNPDQPIDGAAVDIDLPWRLKTTDLFDNAPVSLTNISPSNSITGRLIDYQIVGQQLQSVNEIQLGDEVFTQSDFIINNSGTMLWFSATAQTPGFKTLTVSQTDTNKVAILPASVLISQAIEITGVNSNNSVSDQALSDSGGNTITISGLGLNGVISVT